MSSSMPSRESAGDSLLLSLLLLTKSVFLWSKEIRFFFKKGNSLVFQIVLYVQMGVPVDIFFSINLFTLQILESDIYLTT